MSKMEPFSLALKHQLALFLKLFLILVYQLLKLLNVISCLVSCVGSHESPTLDLFVDLIKL